ncbi:MAG TPA: 3-deoxy-8-phosphooctulonate synthase, partial [Bacteroidetes bacterium]|nr:3-deoxy-8-phosphooctulonate synthase [Bacteroidota bacterium]HEX04646.1 3-deoxy-8-phosphooctulonate synthase [Bacteroidota bacterium]
MNEAFGIREINPSNPHPLLLIAGPCVLQTEDLALRIAETIRTIADKHNVRFIFKASFDKANRTSGLSKRGPGLDEGLEILRKVRDTVGVPVITDVHDTLQIHAAGDVVDMLQIPAFLCRQTDLLMEAGKTGRTVNVKKGQFMAPEDMIYAVDKVKQGGGKTVFLTERGASFGYRNLVVDMRSLSIMREFAPVIFDGTHSVQMPGGDGGKTGGNREMVPLLVRSALAAGIDGLFLEVHPDPDSSPSDGPNMILPKTLEAHLPQWVELYNIG